MIIEPVDSMVTAFINVTTLTSTPAFTDVERQAQAGCWFDVLRTFSTTEARVTSHTRQSKGLESIIVVYYR